MPSKPAAEIRSKAGIIKFSLSVQRINTVPATNKLSDYVRVFLEAVTVLIFIYPLKAIFGAMWYLLSTGQVGQRFSLHTTEAQARTIFAIYALGLIAISAEVLLLNLRAWQLREPLRLNARERLMTRGELTGWSIPVSVGLVSLFFSFTLPIEKIAWCGWVYFLMAIMVRVHWFWHGRRLKAVQERKVGIKN